jgi:hypothetical protein
MMLLLAIPLAGSGPAPGSGLPAIVFVSRQPVPGDPRAIPGLGPHQRAIVTGGRLWVRERDGRVRELIARDALYDASDPAVSPDGRRVAFAGTPGPDRPWRLWVVALEGDGLRPVTGDDDPERAGSAGRYDDLDPCWLDDSTLVFASTRFPQRAEYADLPVTNLFTVCVSRDTARRCAPRRITAERNGAEEPAVDYRSGRIVFTRWWFNRYRAANLPVGITTDPALAIARDTVNLWQVMSIAPNDRRPRLAGGDLAARRGTMGYQPCVLADGSLLAVYAANLGLSPRPGGVGIHRLSRRFDGEQRLAGALVSARAGDVYGGTEGLAPPAACSPAALPDGRVLFSYDPGARGDLGLYVMRADGTDIRPVFDRAGTLELDAAPVVVRRLPRPGAPPAGDEREDPEAYSRARAAGREPLDEIAPAREPAFDLRHFPPSGATFRFHDLDVFADGPPGAPGHGAAPRTPGARMRFFATLARPDAAGGDSAFLVREVPVGKNGEINERGLPADVPMFEQLLGPDGRVLMTAHGPAHVAGFNAGVAGTATRCVGCHLGHSTLPIGTVSHSTGGGR